MSPEVRAFLETLLDVLDMPSPPADHREYARLLEDRTLDVLVSLRGVLGEPLPGADAFAWETAYLRKQLAKKQHAAPDGGDRS